MKISQPNALLDRALSLALRYPRLALWHAHRALAVDCEGKVAPQATALIVALTRTP